MFFDSEASRESGRSWVGWSRANLLPAALAAGRWTGILTDSHEFPHLCASVAQLVEQLICNQQVVGSSPSASSSKRGREMGKSGELEIEWSVSW